MTTTRTRRPRHPLVDPDALFSKRIAAHLSQSELARRSGVTQQQISMAEQGKGGIGVAALGKLANALGCPIEDLMPPRQAA